MENQTPLAGLNPADLLRQGVAEDTFMEGASSSFNPTPIEELAPLFPQFEILELIGKGGMGAVYKVRQKDLDRIVALKILPPAIGQSAAFASRFTREAKALAKLNHPGIVTIHEFGQTSSSQLSTIDSQPLYFILMEFVDGVNLAQLMKTGRVSPREALAIVPQICDALQYAHDQGIVHRDIKPENILLDRLGRVKVADFGIAKVVAAASEDPIRSGDTPVPTDATLAGKIIGTPQYMAPEQIEHPSEVDHRADIYALGVVFYQMLTGELPGNDLQSPSRKVSIDVRLDEIVLRALEKEPEKRYQTAVEFRTVMEGVRELENVTDKPTSEGNGDDALESDAIGHPLISSWFQSFIGLLLVLCLPGALVVPYFQDTSGQTWHTVEYVFTIPGQVDESQDVGTLTELLAPYQGIVLKVDSSNKKWKISATDADRTTAEHKLDQACAAIQREYDKGKTRKLAEPIVWESRDSMSSNVLPITSRPAFIANLKRSLWAGLLLSAVGMLCLLVRRERRRFEFGNPGTVVLVLVMLGCFSCLFVPGPFRSLWGFLLFGGVLMGGSVIAVALGGRFMRFEFWMLVGTWVSTVAFLVVGLSTGGSRMDPGWKAVPVPVIQTGPQPAPLDVGAATGKEPMEGRYLEAVMEWLGEIDSGRYEKAWSEATAFARLLESPSQWATKMDATRTPLGKVLSREQRRRQWTSNLSGAPEGEYLIYVFRTEFESGPRMLETVTLMFEKDGNWRVMGYSIEKDSKSPEKDENGAASEVAVPAPESSQQERLVDLEIAVLVARKKFLPTHPDFKQAAMAVAGFIRENPSSRDANYGEVLGRRRNRIIELKAKLASEYGAQHPRILEQVHELEAVEHLIRTKNTRVIRKPDTSVSGGMKFHFDCGGDTMQLMAMRFRKQYGVRVCYECAGLKGTFGVNLNTMADVLVELEVKEASGELTEREKERLTEVRRYQSPENIGLSEKYYSGEIVAASLEDFFNQLTKDTPYQCRSSASGETWMVYPKVGSWLDFPVTLDTQDLTVEEAFEKVCSQSPEGRILLNPRQQNQPFGMVPWRDVRCRPQRFNQQPAWEVLCRIGEQAEPDSIWDFTDPLVIQPGCDSVYESGVTFTAQHWLAGIDAGNYAQSWKDAAAFFQKAITEAAWSDSLAIARRPLGEMKSRKLRSATNAKTLPGAPDGEYVVIQFETSFTAKKDAIETVTFVKEKDGKWRAAGYFIR